MMTKFSLVLCLAASPAAAVSLRGSRQLQAGGIDLSALYKILAKNNKSWNFLANASDDPATNSMNVAFPNFGTQYYGTAFDSATTFTVHGAFPDEASGVHYAALTVYNKEGLIEGDESASSINFQQPAYSKGKTFTKTFTCTGPCIILNRQYRPLSELNKPSPCTFQVFKGSDTSSSAIMAQATTKDATRLGQAIAPAFRRAIAGGGDAIPIKDTQLYKPPNSALPGLLPNANAKYLVTAFSNTTSCMVFTGTTPHADNNSATKFYSFMASDMATTETVASIDMDQMGGWGKDYELFVCRTEKLAQAQGYTAAPGQFLLEFDNTALYGIVGAPGVILREINTGTCEDAAVPAQGCGGLWDPKYESPESPGEISVENCKAALGTAYPMMRHSAGSAGNAGTERNLARVAAKKSTTVVCKGNTILRGGRCVAKTTTTVCRANMIMRGGVCVKRTSRTTGAW